jgi:Zn-dependent peptidase ImmA (M78 family)
MSESSAYGLARSLSFSEELAVAEALAACARAHYKLPSPINGPRWCALAGVELHWSAQYDEGRYIRSGNHVAMHLREGEPPHRSNFTLAHELGHHVIEESKRNYEFRIKLDPLIRRLLGYVEPGSLDEESLCDRIAGSLLIGAEELRSWRDSCRHIDVHELHRLARSFDATPQTALRRLNELHDFEAMYLIVVEVESKVWRVESCHGQPRWFNIPAELQWTPGLKRSVGGETIPGKWSRVVCQDLEGIIRTDSARVGADRIGVLVTRYLAPRRRHFAI